MKMNRLFEITIILLNKGSVTAKELADRFGVSTRTIYRDIDVLSSTGVPVYTNKGNGGGIHLLESYAIERTLISEQESENLLLAIKTLQATQYPELDMILEKMGAIFKHAPDHDWVEVDFSPWGSAPNDKNKFNDIKRAMLQRQVLCFDYVDGEGHKSNRLAEPAKLLFKDNAWYLVAHCRQRQAQRTFRISRMKNLKTLTETFTPQVSPQPEPAESKAEKQPLVSLKLRFQAKVLNRLYDYFADSLISHNADGSFTLDAVLPEGEWLYGYILSLGSFVEVQEPEHVRQLIASRLQQALNIYEI
ncbi:helix-turn-helix transcriptional regulator [Sporomusa aerivorans]|uniref:helix-turn-helix transcriptional regulator n=1 Tax=Sporomusa aerivorans TaxID=204936 RepID=UPI00352A9883